MAKTAALSPLPDPNDNALSSGMAQSIVTGSILEI